MSVSGVTSRRSKSSKNCYGCKKNFQIKDKKPLSLECNGCRNSFCLPCLNISDGLYEALVSDNSGSIMTACVTCKGIVLSTNALKEQVTKDIAKYQAANKKSFDEINVNLKKLKSEIKEEIKAELTDTINEQVKTEVETKSVALDLKLSQQHTELVNYVEERISENNQIQRKKRNLVLYQIPESKSEVLSTKISDDELEALNFFTEFASDCEITTSNIIKADRIGKSSGADSSSTSSKPRPLRIVMDSDNLKFRLLSKYRQRRRTGFQFSNGKSLSQDYTPQQRKKYRAEKVSKATKSDSVTTIPAEEVPLPADDSDLDTDPEVIPNSQTNHNSFRASHQ